MKNKITVHLCLLTMLGVGAAVVTAQIQLPSAPQKQFGASVTPSFEGWYDNPDGTHNFLIGYFSRNTEAELDIPIGPENRIEPGGPDMGQPTHFLSRRRYGMFVITVPKDFPKTQKISWTLTANGVTTTIPFYMHTDYNITPLRSSEEAPNGDFNRPAVLKLEANGPSFTGPGIALTKALSRTATVGTPMPLDFFIDDDALYSSGGNGPMRGGQPPVSLVLSKYRGPGKVTFTDARVRLETLKGGKPLEAYQGKGATTVNFSEAGDYVLHVTANDYSGNGGGGSGCCWTNAMIKVGVKAAGAR